MERQIFRLDDSVIAQIVRVIQLGFLTGTDISDYMRQFRLEPGMGNSLQLTSEYIKHDKETVEKLLAQATELQEKPDDLN